MDTVQRFLSLGAFASRVSSGLAYLLALGAGLCTAYVDVRTDEVVVTLVPLLTFCALLGLARPARAWRWGLIVGMWIPIAHWTAFLGAAAAPSTEALAPLLALLPASLGAYVGALAARAS